MKKILLVDGNSILNRGYYGLPLLSDKNGIYTNGVLGFLNILFKEIADEKPDYLTVAFDLPEPTFRHKMYDGYKGTRNPAPEELVMQFPIIREVLDSMGVCVVEKSGYEADDILGTLAKKSEANGVSAVILSGDRDLLQIASENIKISIPKTSMGKTETYHYFAEDVKREYGVTPVEFIEVKALQGDSSDNIPGVSKVGPKTATELICKYHSLEGIYEHIDEITAKALHEHLVTDREQAFFSRVLSKILTDAPVEPDYDNASLDGMLNDKSMETLIKYSLKSVIAKLEALKESSPASTENTVKKVEYRVIEDFNDTNALIAKVAASKSVGICSFDSNGIAVSVKEGTYFIRCYGFVTMEYLADELAKAFRKVENIYSYRVKNIYPIIGEYRSGVNDCELLAYLDDPLKGDYPITYLAMKYLQEYYGDEKLLAANPEEYCALCASLSVRLYDVLMRNVQAAGMDSLYRNIEMPLSHVLYAMEKEGIYVDCDGLKRYSEQLSQDIDKLEQTIYSESGVEFNINSPKQLGEVLFDRLKLPSGKKTKSGYSTAADILEKLAPDYPVVKHILDYRQLTKLKSTYADGLQAYIEEDGRIHTHFNQTITATGRISSTEPNLQNIPVRTELGRLLRKVFLPREGCVFVDADYSQIELRIMAHMSGDENLINAYRNNQDIHRSTASLVFDTPFDEVTDKQRRDAKAVNFGIIYGISAYGLSEDTGIPINLAKEYINNYFLKYPAIKAYLDEAVASARESGFSKTIFGRVRPIPELKSNNFIQRSFGERVAMNAPLQGTAADIMKIAMIRIFNRLKDEGLKSKLLIQVHDEVLVETYTDELDKVKSIVVSEMENAASLKVKLVSEVNTGNTWYDAK